MKLACHPQQGQMEPAMHQMSVQSSEEQLQEHVQVVLESVAFVREIS